MEYELGFSFKLVANVVRSGVWQFVYDTKRPAFLERDLVGLCEWQAAGRSGFDTVLVKWCPFNPEPPY